MKELLQKLRMTLGRSLNLRYVIEAIEGIRGPLNDKQKLLIYLSLLSNEISFRRIYEVLEKVINALSLDILKEGLHAIIKVLDYVFMSK